MLRLTARHIVRSVEVLSPFDSVGRAAELLRASGCSAVPVGENGHLSGLVSEADLQQALMHTAAFFDNGSSSPGQRDGMTVRDIMSASLFPVRSDLPLSDLVQVFRHYPVPAVPVIDETGAYRGMVSRADLTSAMYRALRPPTIGGMATPLGVFLTTGNVTAGASHVALMLTGALMAAMMGVTYAVLVLLLSGIDHYFGTRWTEVLLSPSVVNNRGQTELVVFYAIPIAEILGFFLVLRFLPLAGYHAAEHQTVHAIERGLPLELPVVRTMPRPHPRCGTNLAAIILLTQILLEFQIPVPVAMILLVILFFTWRSLGMKLQYYFTTKPATDRQLLNGIAVGKELLDRYQDHVGEAVPIWKKIWNMGLPQMILGGAITFQLAQLAYRLLLSLFGHGRIT